MLPFFFTRTAYPWLTLLCLALIGLSAASRARADQGAPAAQPSWAIEITKDSLCANDADFRAHLASAIPERQRATVEQAELRARVTIARDQTGTLSVFDQLTQREAGRRQISVPRGGCSAAADALALVIAVMVEAGRSVLPATDTPPEAPPEKPVAPPPEKPEEPRADDTTPPEPASPSYKRPARYAWQGPAAGHDLTLNFAAGVGLLPGPNLGGSIGWGIRGARIWPVWLNGTGWAERPSSDERGRFGAAYLTLSTCPLYWKRGIFRTRLCPGVAAGTIWSSGGQRLVERYRTVSFLALGSLAGAVHFRIVGPLELVIEARLEVPITKRRFEFERLNGSRQRSHETADVTGSFFGGLGLCFR